MQSNRDPKKIDLENLPKENLVRDLESGNKMSSKKTLFPIIGIIIAGILSGFIMHNYLSKDKITSTPNSTDKAVSTGQSAGSTDTKTFKDSAEGELELGGLNGEGTHKLTRPGGDNQTVYLTSSVLDLGKYVGKKVRVWGQTFSAQKAGWLMDIGRIEVL